MSLRVDGSETNFEESYRRAPFAPLIHIVVLAADAAVKLAGRRNPVTDVIFGDLSRLQGRGPQGGGLPATNRDDSDRLTSVT